MHTSFLFTATVAGLVAAAPTKRQQANSTTINIVTSAGLDPNQSVNQMSVGFNKLINLDNLSMSSASLDTDETYGVSPDEVACQFYRDLDAIEPAGLLLTSTSSPIRLTTNLVEAQSVICILRLADQTS